MQELRSQMERRYPSMVKSARMTLTCADLFAGAGGLSVGFEAAGFRPIFFNEFDQTASDTYMLNCPGAKAFVRPIQELDAGTIQSECDLQAGALDILLGGPPCQGFSINAPVRSDTDPRNHLFRHYIRLLEGRLNE